MLVVKLLLQLDITGVLDVNCPDSCGSTPLMDAARGNHLDCIVPLLERLELNLSVKDRYSFVGSMNVS